MVSVFDPSLGTRVDYWRFLQESREEPMRAIIFVGQSNMVGTNEGPRFPFGIDQMPPNVLCQDADNLIAPFRYPLPFYQANSTTFEPVAGANDNVGPYISFMQELAKRSPESRFVASLCAAGGSSITSGIATSNWAAPGSPYKLANNLYDWVVARINALIQQGVVIECIVWCQGENDAANLQVAGQSPIQAQVTYSNELQRIIRSLRNGGLNNDLYGSQASKPFIILEMPRTLSGNGGSSVPVPGLFPAMTQAHPLAIESAKRAVAMGMPYTAYVESGGLASTVDNIHYTANAARQLGIRAAGAIEVARRNVSDTTPNAEVGLPSWPRGRLILATGRRVEAEMGNSLRSAGLQGVGISDSVGTRVQQLHCGTGAGTILTMPLAFDGAHGVSVDFLTGAKAGYSFVCANGAGLPEGVLQVDGVVGLFGDFKQRMTPYGLTLERNGVVAITMNLNTGVIENHAVNGPLILKSPDGTRYALRVANGGTLSITPA